ncbi:MAG: TolC family protein [Bacteroidia bacterium]|nr:TolC family protein [Bacteroidia bacterium]
MSRRILIVAIFCLSFCGAFGQNSISLQDAINLTLENNYGIRISALDQEIARNNNNWGAAGRLPRLDLNVNGSRFQSGNPGSFVPQRTNLGVSPSLNWTLFDGYRIEANKARLEELEKLSYGNAAIIIENNLQAVILAYYQGLLAQEQLEVLQEVLKNSRERLEYESFKTEIGTSGSFDLLQFKNALLTDSANVLSQEVVLKNSLRNLKLIMGVEMETEVILRDPLQENFPPIDWDPLLEKMLSDNNNLRNQYINNNILREDIRIARANRYPTISMNAGTTFSTGQLQLINRDPNTAETMPFVTRNVTAFDFSAGITIAFNLYNGGNTRRLIENARINERIGKLQQEDLERSLENDLIITFDQYQSRRELLLIQLASVENSRQSLEMSKDRFQNGLINSLDYRNIQLQYLNAQFAKFQALRNLKESETELLRLSGALLRE